MKPRISGACSCAWYATPRPPPRSTWRMAKPCARSRVDQRQHPVDGFQNRVGVHQLRADMAAHALGRKVRQMARALVDRFGLARCRCRTCARAVRSKCTDASTRPRRDSRAAAKPACTPRRARQRIDQRQFRLRLAIEHADAALERVIHLRGGLAHAGKNHLATDRRPRLQHAIQFAAGNDVESRAGLAPAARECRATSWPSPRSRRCAASRRGLRRKRGNFPEWRRSNTRTRACRPAARYPPAARLRSTDPGWSNGTWRYD